MAVITPNVVDATYEAARRVYGGGSSVSDEVHHLAEKFGLNAGSGRDFIENYKRMREGVRYTRTLNGYATRRYLEGILADNGMAAFQAALVATKKHIEYYESLGHGRLINIREIVVELEAFQPIAEFQFEKFEAEVSKLYQMSREERMALTPKIPEKPARLVKQIIVFSRNAAIAAETLRRANGQCQDCGNTAPFVRKSDGTPYLEVHHVLRLADDGPDSLENTLALCPNCHRKWHFG